MTIKEHRHLIAQEAFSAITWELDFSQACSFPRMLMNHKNFHVTQIPDKTNDMIFLKSPSTMFLGHFWQFLDIFARWDFFQKIFSLSHATLYGPLTPCWVSEKTNKPIPRKLTKRRKNGRTDGQTLFYRTRPAEDEGPIRKDSFNFRWYLLAAFPTNEKQDVSPVWPSFSIYFKF